MSKMLFCPEHKKVWAYDHAYEEHTIEDRICHDCEEDREYRLMVENDPGESVPY